MVHELDTVVITKDLFQDTIQDEYMNTTPLGALVGLGVPAVWCFGVGGGFPGRMGGV